MNIGLWSLVITSRDDIIFGHNQQTTYNKCVYDVRVINY